MFKLLSKVIIRKKLLLNLVNLLFLNKYIENIKNKKRNSIKLLTNNNRTRTFYYNNSYSDIKLLINWFLVIFLICDHLKLAQSRKLLCTPCEIKSEIGKKSAINNGGGSSSSNIEGNNDLPAKASYEEYVFEHQVTRLQAIEALQKLNDTFFNGPTYPGCKVFDCSKHLKYCLGSYFLNDHCFCEQSHSIEGLPFVPHSCYVGEENQAMKKPSIGSCFRFSEIKECCCIRPLAKRWKYLSSATNHQKNSFLIVSLMTFLILLNIKFNFKIS